MLRAKPILIVLAKFVGIHSSASPAQTSMIPAILILAFVRDNIRVKSEQVVSGRALGAKSARLPKAHRADRSSAREYTHVLRRLGKINYIAERRQFFHTLTVGINGNRLDFVSA